MASADIRALNAQSRTIAALVVTDGSSSIAQVAKLTRASASLRDLADAIHSLCIVHGAFPGVVDIARETAADPVWIDWADRAAETMAGERALLARLTAAVGPLPSTPGHAASEAAILAQRNALQMLARSDRNGCAIGAAVAFTLDWEAVREVLDVAAARLSVPSEGDPAPLIAQTHALLASLAIPPAIERAMMFGAQQLLAQHRGLWNLLEARASAREAV